MYPVCTLSPPSLRFGPDRHDVTWDADCSAWRSLGELEESEGEPGVWGCSLSGASERAPPQEAIGEDHIAWAADASAKVERPAAHEEHEPRNRSGRVGPRPPRANTPTPPVPVADDWIPRPPRCD
jgi:hypothetical protein